MKPLIYAPKLPLQARTGPPGLDIVVPFTTRPLTRAALTAAGRWSAGLLPLVRMVRTQVVPFPLQLEAAPVSAAVLRHHLLPLAEEFGVHLEICFTRDSREGLLQRLSTGSVILIAVRRHFWSHWLPSREERLANWLRRRGYNVVLEFVDNNYA
jgi:hypothetical protein